jgi:FAD/FMN-containing dehydrogenase
LRFDSTNGLLRAEAGVSLAALNRVFLPRGWFVPVTPGTQFVTLGGMVAADVHGKNHHIDGSLGNYVRSLRLRIASGEIVECTPEHETELFWATIGGMGLTGHILEVEIAMKSITSPWIWQESLRVDCIEDMIAALQCAAATWPMTVGWVDGTATGHRLGRGILIKGRWATTSEGLSFQPEWKRRRALRFDFPRFVMGRFSMSAFNALYYWKHLARLRHDLVTPEAFFYPLDSIEQWNRVYGKRGFTQYQCVLPNAADVRRLFERFVAAGGISWLCVVKDCGPEGRGMLSFPRAGITVAIDIPVRAGWTESLVDQLNEFIIQAGGRIYLAKDAFTKREHFRAMEPRTAKFLEVRGAWDPNGAIRSAQSVRLLGDAA